MTRRQYLVWMAWLPYEAAKIEFQRPQVEEKRRGPERFRLTKEQAHQMNLEAAKLQFRASLGVGIPAKSNGVVTKPR